MKKLLRRGATVKLTKMYDDNVWNALHFAVYRGNTELAKYLYLKGLKFDSPEFTPVDLAMSLLRFNIIELIWDRYFVEMDERETWISWAPEVTRSAEMKRVAFSLAQDKKAEFYSKDDILPFLIFFLFFSLILTVSMRTVELCCILRLPSEMFKFSSFF